MSDAMERMSGRFDHLAIAVEDLEAGAAAVGAVLGVPLEPGGVHPAMGTHNRLLSLGAGAYLEVIAIDPDAPAPGRARWFGLDRFSGPPVPRAWVVRCDDLAAALAVAPEGAGKPMALERGDLRWSMAIPKDGMLPFDGLFPALIAWQGTAHPADRLPDRGIRLVALELAHPEAGALRAVLGASLRDERIRVVEGAAPKLRAVFQTPTGERVLP
jgi:hypothetical protein